MLPRLLALPLIALPALAVAQQPKPAQQPDARLQETLAKLDAASKRFTSAQADFKKEIVNRITRDTVEQTGKVYFDRQHDATQFGMILYGTNGRVDGEDGRIAEYKNGTIKVLNPKLKCYDSVQASVGKTETFLTLGFGGSGQDLKKAWQIADLGPETVAGVKTEKLDLVPLDPGAKANVKHVTLWIDLDRDVSLQQIFYLAGTGDTQTAHYTNIRLNKPVDTAPFNVGSKSCGR